MTNICQECGMVCRTPTEYHPYAACLMFKACHDGDKVRANLEAVRADAPEGGSTFPPRILALLHEVADRVGTEFRGPFEDGNGEPLQDDADAALAWIAAAEAGQEAAAVQANPWHTAVLNECMLTEACYQEADPAATVRALIDWHVANGAAVQAVGAWQDIATAPKDDWILLAAEFDGPGDWRIKMGYFQKQPDEQGRHWRVLGASWTPTHWMPLPAPPAALSGSLGDGGGKG